jgi:hypothetical protein
MTTPSVARLVGHADLACPFFFLISELPGGTRGDQVDVRGKIIAVNNHADAADCQFARPLARIEIRVLNQQESLRTYLCKEVERISRVLINHQVETVHVKYNGSGSGRDEKSLGVERSGLASVCVEPLLSI